MDRGTWRGTVHGVAQSQTRLSDEITTAKDGKLSKIVMNASGRLEVAGGA